MHQKHKIDRKIGGYIFVCLPPYISNFQLFEIKPLVLRTLDLQESTSTVYYNFHIKCHSSFIFYILFARLVTCWVYLLDFFCSSIQFYVLLSPYLRLISFIYLDLYVFGDSALISKGSFMQTKHLCLLIHI